MLAIFLSAFVVGLSGAMMPGSLLTYTIRKALSSGWRAGFIIVAGHALLELGLIAVIFLGFDLVLQSEAAQIAIGLIGGILLGYMGIDMIVGSAKKKISVRAETGEADSGSMFLSGIALSATNPYFLMWWAIIGLGFIMKAFGSNGIAGVSVYYFGHISVDFLWYGLVSIIVGTTRKFIGEKPYRIIIAVLGCALVFFALKFAYGAVESLLKLL